MIRLRKLFMCGFHLRLRTFHDIGDNCVTPNVLSIRMKSFNSKLLRIKYNEKLVIGYICQISRYKGLALLHLSSD